MTDNKSVLIIGLGNYYKKDDGVGLYVAERIRAMNLENTRVLSKIGDGTALINAWTKADRVFVIDAVASKAKVGIKHRFNALKETIPAEMFNGYSTHSFSLPEAIEMAKTLGELPDSLIVYGIEGKDFSSGAGLSSEVKTAADEIIDMLVEEINNPRLTI